MALTIPKALCKSLVCWTSLGNKLVSVCFLYLHGKLKAYAPTDIADEETKDAFFDRLHQTVEKAPPHDITMILTYVNATRSINDRSNGSPFSTIFADRSRCCGYLVSPETYSSLDMVQPRR